MNERENAFRERLAQRLNALPPLALPIGIAVSLVLIMCALVLTGWSMWMSLPLLCLLAAMAAVSFAKKRKTDMYIVIFELVIVGGDVLRYFALGVDTGLARLVIYIPVVLMLAVAMRIRQSRAAENAEQQSAGGDRQ